MRFALRAPNVPSLPLLRACGPGGLDGFPRDADREVRARLPDVVRFFREQGTRLTQLRDPMCAMSVGAALSAPFISIRELNGRARRTVLEAVAADRSPETFASLLALSAATDGRLQAVAGAVAATVSGVPEPPWARPARAPLESVRMETLKAVNDYAGAGLLVTVEHKGRRGVFFARFHSRSLLTERIYFLPEVRRSALLRELRAGSNLTGPYRYVPTGEKVPDRVGFVNALLTENEENLERGRGFPPYPPGLQELPRISDVTVVPALLVLLRKVVGSVSGLEEWDFVSDYGGRWR